MGKKKAVPTLALPPDDAIKVSVGLCYGFGGGYELKANVQVEKAALDAHGVGEVVHLMHEVIGRKIGRWMGTPTVGGQNDRAKKGLKLLTFSWHIEDPVDAYVLGLDIHERNWATKEAVPPEVQATRRAFANRMMRELDEIHQAYHSEMESKGIAEHEELRDNLWKYKYLFRYDQLIDEAKSQGFSWIQVRVFRNSQMRRQAQSGNSAASA